MVRSETKGMIKKLARNRAGNFGIMAALTLPLLIGVGGIAIDMTNLLVMKNRLQAATDAAALAAASALVSDKATDEQAKLVAQDYLKAQMRDGSSTDTKSNETVSTGIDVKISQKATLGNGKEYTVEVKGTETVTFSAMTSLLGPKSTPITAYSKSQASTEAKNALSMFLVLDRSGSMAWDTTTVDSANPTKIEYYECGWSWWGGTKYCTRTVTNYVAKIDALKLAVADLLTQLKIADPTAALVRTGSVSYNSEMQKEEKLSWGVTKVLTYVNALPADGGTDSADAFEKAYKDVKSASEDTAHMNKNGQVPTKYIVFMTDGENNKDDADTETKKSCDKARADKIEVYTVAFMAPDRGQKLLKYCATSTKHYFTADTLEELTAAFKYIGEKASELSSRLTK